MWNEKDANLRNARADWRRVASDVAYVRMLMAGKRWVEAVKREEKFNPNHDELGRFATADGAGSGGGGQVLSDANPDNYFPPGTQVANNDSGGDPNKPGMGHNKPPNPPENNPEQPPQIPEERPPLGRERFRIVKEVAKYLARYGQTLAKIGRGAGWIYEFYPYIKSYLDQPKSLDELQAAVSNPETGYDIHHIAEQTPAEKEGISRDLIDGRDNLVRVPTLKHWQITGWYATRSDHFGGITPREYLRGKSWQEKQRLGLEALRKHGVLKP